MTTPVLVICMLLKDATLTEEWLLWSKDHADRIKFIYHPKVDLRLLPQFRRTRITVRTGWGGPSLVEAEVQLYREGLEIYREGTHFALVSGNCLPSHSCAYVLDAIANEESRMLCLPSVTTDPELKIMCGQQWKLLSRRLTQMVVDEGFESLSRLLQRLPTEPKVSYVFGAGDWLAADEFLIHTFLYNRGEIPESGFSLTLNINSAKDRRHPTTFDTFDKMTRKRKRDEDDTDIHRLLRFASAQNEDGSYKKLAIIQELVHAHFMRKISTDLSGDRLMDLLSSTVWSREKELALMEHVHDMETAGPVQYVSKPKILTDKAVAEFDVPSGKHPGFRQRGIDTSVLMCEKCHTTSKPSAVRRHECC